jgi:hypothetical protein
MMDNDVLLKTSLFELIKMVKKYERQHFGADAKLELHILETPSDYPYSKAKFYEFREFKE